VLAGRGRRGALPGRASPIDRNRAVSPVFGPGRVEGPRGPGLDPVPRAAPGAPILAGLGAGMIVVNYRTLGDSIGGRLRAACRPPGFSNRQTTHGPARKSACQEVQESEIAVWPILSNLALAERYLHTILG
jgi:hypothetical protein